MRKIKRQLFLFIAVLFFGFVFCGAVSAAQYADLEVSSIDCAVSGDGETADFSINIQNKGTIAASNVRLYDKMAGVDVSSSQYSINNGAWQDWNKHYIPLGTMAAGSTMLIEFKADITSNTLINKAELKTSTPEFIRVNNRLSYTTQSEYTITSAAGTGGTINPNGNINVIKGQSPTFTITPDTGYYISDVLVDGSSVGAVPSYTFNNVQSNHTIAATFNRITYTITPSAGTGGTISPSTPQTINHGDSITFTITPDTGWEIADVTVDGNSVGAVPSYTFNNVQANHTINAAFSQMTRAYITNSNSGNVSVIDTSNNTVITTINVGTYPLGVAVSPDGTKAYITNSGSDNVSVINTSNNTVITTINVGPNPEGVAVSPDGTKAYITNRGSDNVSVIDTSNNTVITTINVGSVPVGVAVSPDGTKAYITNDYSDNVSVINTSNNTVTATIGVGNFPYGVAVSPDGTRAYITNSLSDNVSVINTSNNTVITTINVGVGPYGVAVSPDGTRAYITNSRSGNVSVINTSNNTVTATIGVGAYPLGVAVSPDGTRAYITNSLSDNVSVINTSNNTVITTINVGVGPYGVAMSPDGTIPV